MEKKDVQSKIRYFQNWLAGNHLKNMKLQILKQYDKPRPKETQARAKPAQLRVHKKVVRDLHLDGMDHEDANTPTHRIDSELIIQGIHQNNKSLNPITLVDQEKLKKSRSLQKYIENLSDSQRSESAPVEEKSDEGSQ